MNGSHRYTNIERLLVIQNKLRNERKMCYLPDYDVVTTLLCINIFINLSQLKTQSVHHAILKNNHLQTGLAIGQHVIP